jgi:tetratricopeptide (TPR) repeat protein
MSASRKALFIVCLLCITFSAPCRTSIALFPLQNRTADPLLDWIGFAVPDMFFRGLQAAGEMQVWDPVFLFGADSVGWRMDSIAPLKEHAGRWRWNYALGGSYTIDSDTISITFRIVQRKESQFSRKETKLRCTESACAARLCDSLASVVRAFNAGISPAAVTGLTSILDSKPWAYSSYARGYGYEMNNQFAEAISAYSCAIARDPRMADAYSRIGSLYALTGNLRMGIRYLDSAIACSAQKAQPVACKANILIKHGLPAEALAFVQKNRVMFETTLDGMLAIGRAYGINGEYDRAIASLTRVVAAGAPDLSASSDLGSAWRAAGNFDQAADIFTTLTEYRPMYTNYRVLLGSTYRLAGHMMESFSVLEAALRLEPDNPAILISLAVTCFDLKWYDKSRQLLLKSLAIQPRSGEALVNLGVIYWFIGKSDSASALFAQAVRCAPELSQAAMNNEANMLLRSGKINPALKSYRQADATGKKSMVVLTNMGDALAAIGRDDDAFASYEEALFLAPNSPEILLKQADLALRMQRDTVAENSLRKLLEMNPYDHDVTMRLALLCKKQQRFKNAVTLIEDYLTHFPSDRPFRLLLPATYRAMKWYEVAIMEYEKLIADPAYRDDPECYLGLGLAYYDLIRFKRFMDFDKAIRYLQLASDRDPANPEPEIAIGRIYRDHRQLYEPAIEHWKKALARTADPQTRKTVERLIAEVPR